MDDAARYAVPADKRAQLVYMREAIRATALVCLLLARNGGPMRYFPVGAKSSLHVPLAVVEDLFHEGKIDVLVAAPEGVSGTVILDVGFVEID